MAKTITVYIMAFTPQKLDNKALSEMVGAARNMLEGKDPAFKKTMSQAIADKAGIKASNQLFVPLMHTPQTMRTTLEGWLTNEKLIPRMAVGETFFPHGMRDGQGRENFVLFYFHRL